MGLDPVPSGRSALIPSTMHR